MPDASRWGGAAPLATALLSAAVPPAAAQPAQGSTAPAAGKTADDPASLAVQDVDGARFESMRHADGWRMQGRYDHLYPVILKLFDVPTMARSAVGPDFAKLSPDRQATLRDAFGKLRVASFASTFDDFKGETCAVDGDAAVRGQDRFVKTRFDGEVAPVDTAFLLRRNSADWRIVDIDGTIPQLATWRSEHGSTVQDGGFDRMMAAVKAQTEKDMKAF